MTKVALSVFKAKMSYYLKLVKAGEDIELQERGSPIAKLTAQKYEEEDLIVKPKQSPQKLQKMKFSVKLTGKGPDAVQLLLEDRARR